MIVKLLTEHHLEFLSLTGGCRGSSESTPVKMPHCWKSHALAHMFLHLNYFSENSASSIVYKLFQTLYLELMSSAVMFYRNMRNDLF